MRSPIAGDRDVRRGMRRGDLRIGRELPLEREHGRHALAPELPSRRSGSAACRRRARSARPGSDARRRRARAPCGRRRGRSVDGRRDPGPLDLVRLEDGVAVRDDDRRAERSQVRQRLERTRSRDDRRTGSRGDSRDASSSRGSPILALPPLLHGAEVVAVAELDEAALLDRPVAARSLLAVSVSTKLAWRSSRIRSLSSSVLSTSTRNDDGIASGHDDILAHHPS